MNLTKRQKIGAGLGLAAGVLYWRHAAKSSASSSSAGSGIDPLTGLPASQDNQTDPLTGLTYLAEAQQYGSVAAAEAAFSGATAGQGYSAPYGGGYGGTAGYPTSNVGGGSTPAGYSTNAQWAQAVQAGLAQLGYDPQAVAAALGAFFAQMPLTPDQARMIQAAEAEFGPPPQGTYAIIPQPSPGGGGNPPPPAGGGPITAVPGNFHVAKVSGLQVTVAWDPVQVPAGQGPLAGYTVAYGQQPGNTPYELAVGPGATSATITFNSGPGAHGLTHYFEVWARPASPGGPHAGPIPAKTQ